MIDADITEFAGLAIGPSMAFHQRPQPSSESLRTRAGETTAVMNAGARTRAATKS